MQDVYVETEALTLPLRFAMVASRVAAVLKGLHLGGALDQKGKQALYAAGDMLERAAKGGTVLRDKSMAGYSAEAMSAYRLVRETKLPEAESRDAASLVQWLKEIAEGLRNLAENRQTNLPVAVLQNFFALLTQRSLDESAGPAEIVDLPTVEEELLASRRTASK